MSILLFNVSEHKRKAQLITCRIKTVYLYKIAVRNQIKCLESYLSINAGILMNSIEGITILNV